MGRSVPKSRYRGTRKGRRGSLALLAAAGIGLGALPLARAQAPVPLDASDRTPPGDSRPDTRARLRAALDRIVEESLPEGGRVSLAVRSLATGEELYARNGDDRLVLASNTKLVTTAVALLRLGEDYTFTTGVWLRGRPGTATASWDGDLIVVGGGDPGFSARLHDGDLFADADALIDAILSRPLRHVTGRLVLDPTFFDGPQVHPGWPRDQLFEDYCAPSAALAINESTVDITIVPGAKPEAPVSLSMSPPNHRLQLVNQMVTTRRSRDHLLAVWRKPGDTRVQIKGRFLLGADPQVVTVSVPDAVALFADVFASRLAAAGVVVEGGTTIASDPYPLEECVPVVRHEGVRLARALQVMNKESENFWAEQVFRTVAAEVGGEGSWTKGVEVATKTLEDLGISREAFTLADGSGLSRENRFSARGLTALLAAVYERDVRDALVRSLPIAGIDGSLANRQRGTRAQGHVRAKTGTIDRASTLSGYAQLPGGEVVAFSFLCNDIPLASRARALQDRLVEALFEAAAPAPAGG